MVGDDDAVPVGDVKKVNVYDDGIWIELLGKGRELPQEPCFADTALLLLIL